MRVLLFLSFVLPVGSLEAHQGVFMIDEMHKIMMANPYRIAMRSGVCLLDISNWVNAIGHETFSRGTMRQWAEISCNTDLPPFVMSKGFYRIDEEAAPHHSWGGVNFAQSNAMQSASASRVQEGNFLIFGLGGENSYVQSSNGGLLSFLGHENLEAIHTH